MATVTAAKSGLASDTGVLANYTDGNTLACGAYNICWDVDMSSYTGVTITGTGIHFFPTGATLTYPTGVGAFTGSTTPLCYPGDATIKPPFITVTTATNFNCGSLFIGNSTIDPIPVPGAQGPLSIKLAGAGILAPVTPAVNIYGAVPTINWTTIATTTDAHATTGYIDTTHFTLTNDLGFRTGGGDSLIVGQRGLNAALDDTGTAMPWATCKGVYTIADYNAGTKAVHLTGAMGGTARQDGDYVGWYSRPIQIFKPAYNSTLSTITGTSRGVLYAGMRLGSNGPHNMHSITSDGTGATLYFLSAIAVGGNTFTNSTSANVPLGFVTNARGDRFIGCLGINGLNGAFVLNGGSSFFDNCAGSNNTSGFVNNCSNVQFLNCVAQASSTATGNFSTASSDQTFINCQGKGGNSTGGDIATPGNTRAYDCTFASTVPVYGYNLATRQPYDTIQFYNTTVVATLYDRYMLGRAGKGYVLSTQPTAQKYNGNNTMLFTVEVANKPLLWVQPFTLPANKSLTFNVPCYRPSTNAGTTSVAVWVYRPRNNPLWYDPTWTNTPTVSESNPASAATTGNVTASGVMSSATNTWEPVTVTIASQAYKRDLVAAVVVKSTSANDVAYAYIDALENIMAKKRIYL